MSRLLRSRRLAVGLIFGVIAWSVLGTLVPQESLTTSAEVSAWIAQRPAVGAVTAALGLHHAYSAPVFLALVALLALSTAACSQDRTRVSWRAFRRSGSVAEGEIRRLRERPDLAIPLRTGHTGDLEPFAAPLRAVGLRVRRGPKLLEASAGRVGLLGSPVFHWVLTALFVLIALGRLTRAEGLIGVPLGSPVTDSASAYGRLERGPLYPGHSGLRFGVSELAFDYRDAAGTRRGVSPLVTVYRGRAAVARQHVHPNNPLRLGKLMIHMDGYGLAARFSLEGSGTPSSTDSLLDFDASRPSGTTEQVLELADASGKATHRLSFTVPADRDGIRVVQRLPRDPRVEVVLASAEGSAPPVTLRPGSSVPVPGGYRLTLDRLDYYARLSIADDWSIYPMYVLFVLAAVAMSVSVLMPYRRVLIMPVDTAEGVRLHAVFRHRRGDPLFAERVETALNEGAGRYDAHEEESA